MKDESLIGTAVTIRMMDRVDIAQVAALEETCFDDPWLGEVIAWTIAKQQASGVVAIIQGKVAGYAIYQLEGDEEGSFIRISRLAVHPALRRTGIGSLLCDAVIGRLTVARRRIAGAVRESNLSSQLFMRSQGFICSKMIEGYFSDYETAYVFELIYNEEDFYGVRG
jgi:ribosomal-protein-alanine N-acetyltransferase